MGTRLHCVSLILAAFLASAPSVFGHAVEGANLQLIAELTDEKLIYEISAETSLVPPLAHLTFGTETFPTVDEIKEPLVRYFAEHCPVLIDGIAVMPVLEEIQFDPLENQVNLGSVSNFVMAYLFLHYPVKTAPQTANMTWDIFLPEAVKDIVPQTPDPTGHTPQTVDSIFYTFGELDLMTFTPEEPQYIWHNPKPILSVDAAERLRAAAQGMTNRTFALAWPLAGLLVVLAGAAKLKRRPRLAVAFLIGSVAAAAANQALTIQLDGPERLNTEAALQRFKDLHQNIYRAFDYDTDDAIYDTLAQSVDGALLDTIYADIYRSLILKDEGGAVCRVKSLEYLSCLPAALGAEESGFAFDAHWRVHGLVQHWGHTHERVNEYQARYHLAPVAGRWKIREVEISQEKRLNPRTLQPVN